MIGGGYGFMAGVDSWTSQRRPVIPDRDPYVTLPSCTPTLAATSTLKTGKERVEGGPFEKYDLDDRPVGFSPTALPDYFVF